MYLLRNRIYEAFLIPRKYKFLYWIESQDSRNCFFYMYCCHHLEWRVKSHYENKSFLKRRFFFIYIFTGKLFYMIFLELIIYIFFIHCVVVVVITTILWHTYDIFTYYWIIAQKCQALCYLYHFRFLVNLCKNAFTVHFIPFSWIISI